MKMMLLSLIVALYAVVAVSAASDACSAITQRAPCGQIVDDAATCAAKQCCFDGSDAVTPCFYPGGNAVNITTVYVIQACHFDAGFANTTVDILNLWFDQHFVTAAKVGNALNPNQTADKLTPGPALRFMAQSWIVSLYTDCPPNAGLHCPTAAQLANFESAVQKGYITWHAFPFNAELELLNSDLLAFGIEMTADLDAKYGVRRKTVLSQRDVPGMSKAALATLAANGVRAITVGVNGASTPPSVPRAFNWLDTASNTSMPAMWHPGGYGGITYEDAIIIPGLNVALIPDWRGDNEGPPPTPQDVLQDWAAIAQVFPGAAIISATWEDWVDLIYETSPAPSSPPLSPPLRSSQSLSRQSTQTKTQLTTQQPQQRVLQLLPTLTTEIGETWIHGAPSDPHKQAWFKQWQAIRSQCLASGACDPINDYAFRNFSRFLIKAAEHTDGKDVKTFLHDAVNWSNEKFQQALSLPNFQDMVASWVEQRAFGIDYALAALPTTHPLYAPLQASLQAVYPQAQPDPSSAGWIPFIPNSVYTAGRYEIGFDPTTGAIGHLLDSFTNQIWANGLNNELLGYLEYQTYDETTYDAFIADYCYFQPPPDWFLLDFGKPNVSLANPQYQELQQTLAGVWLKTDANAAHFIVQSVFADSNGNPTPNTQYGAPAVAWTLIDIPTSTDAASNSAINMTVQLFGKTATRLPEAMFLRFNFSRTFGTNCASDGQYYTSMYGELVDPFDVQLRGNRKHHGVHDGIMFTKRNACGGSPTANATAFVDVFDTPVVNFGKPFGLPTPTTEPADPLEGASFLLLDNTWGTNYVMWTPFLSGDENIQWHFQLRFPTK